MQQVESFILEKNKHKNERIEMSDQCWDISLLSICAKLGEECIEPCPGTPQLFLDANIPA